MTVARRLPGLQHRAVTDAAALRALHRPGDPLVLPNAWDAGSARAVVAAGFPVVATSSAAVAESLGYGDHEGAPAGEMLDAIARIAEAVDVPVTADLERGYGMPAAELVERLATAGAAGCNLEDSNPRTRRMVDPSEQADLLAAVREAARDAGLDLVLNARVDSPDLDEALDRCRRYARAGADCVFPIFLSGDIATLVRGAGAPVNILYRPGSPSLAELAAMGVARISLGPGPYRVVQAHLAHLLAEIAEGRSPYSPGAG
jgi:2-methylisocitrate lyase-like PEP mutase family enzyme